MLSFKSDMRKIMLTVFKHNPEAQKFFRAVMKFDTDETCPIDDVYEQVSHIHGDQMHM
jgi:histone deacetylase complex regulatory component SIN3